MTGSGDLRQMDASNDSISLPVRVHTSLPPISDQTSSHTLTSRRGQVPSLTGRNPPVSGQECHRESPSLQSSVLLHLPHNEKFRGVASYFEPQEAYKFIKPPSFKSKSLAAVLPELKTGWWGATLDLKDAHLHVPIHTSSRKWLGFAINGNTYRFRCLPFGLSTSPRTFTRVVKVIAEHLRRHGIYVFVYLDDWFLSPPSPSVLLRQITRVLKLGLISLGLIVNFLSLLKSWTSVGAKSFLQRRRSNQLYPQQPPSKVVKAPQAFSWMRMLGLIAICYEMARLRH